LQVIITIALASCIIKLRSHAIKTTIVSYKLTIASC